MKNPGSKLLLTIVLVWSVLYKPGTILVREGGKELLKAELKKGGNSLLLTVPAVKCDKRIIFTTTINGGKAVFGFKNYLIAGKYPTIFDILNPCINRILNH